jgi:hypothetical protein
MSTPRPRRILGVILVLVFGAVAWADVPRLITYQGRLTGQGDDPVDLTIRFYDAQTEGNLLFEETHENVARADGLFTIQIGAESPDGVPNSALDAAEVWLGIAVNGGAELTPRQCVTAAPFALNTPGVLVHDSGDVDIGMPTGEVNIRRPLQIVAPPGDDFATLRLRNSAGYYYMWQVAPSGPCYLYDISAEQYRIFVASDGNVGIGIADPAGKLHISRDDGDPLVPGAGSIWLTGDDTDGELLLGVCNSGAFVQSHDSSDLLINPVGNNVGVGTSNAQHALDVLDPLVSQVAAFRIASEGPGNTRVLVGTDIEYAGKMETFGPNGNINCAIGSYTDGGAGNHGWMSVNDAAGSMQAGMYVDASGNGIVFGDTKSFRCANPKDDQTEIWYACLEGPEAAAYVRGTAMLADGNAVVPLPEHFQAVASEQSITVQLTPLSADSLGLAVVQKRVDSFAVKELHRGTGSYEFDYMVTAVRKGHEDFRVIRPATEARPVAIGTPASATCNPWFSRAADAE